MLYFYCAIVGVAVLEFFAYLIISDRKLLFNTTAFYLFAITSSCATLMSVLSFSQEDAVTAQKISYLSDCMLNLVSLFIVLDICHVKLKKWLRSLLYAYALFVTGLAFATQCKLPDGTEIATIYNSISIERLNDTAIMHKDYAWAHPLFYVLVFGYMLAGVATFCVVVAKRKKISYKNAVPTMLLYFFTIGTYLFARTFNIPYEITPVAMVLSEGILLYITYRSTMNNIEDVMLSSISMRKDAGYIFLDKKYRYLGSTPVASEFLPAIKSLKIDRSFTSEESPELMQIAKQVKNFDGNENSFVYTMGDKDIRSIVAYMYHGDKVTGYYVVLRDETVQQNYIRTINRISENKSNFLSNVSHEIRTPINSVLGMNEMILRESDDEQILEYADNINTSGKTLLQLINDILDLSKIESGKLELFPDKYELRAMLLDVENMIAPLASNKQLEFHVEADKDIHNNVYGDCVRVKQILVNILNNAVKYTDKGRIDFSVREEGSGENTVFYFSVADTGHGIRPESMDSLFSAYDRIDEKANAGIEGTGLGLSITKKFVELMGGKIEVTSTFGVGSTFTVILPQPVTGDDTIGDFRNVKLSKPTGSSYKESFHAPEAEVLVVDDTLANLTVVRALLKKTLVNIDTAKSGEECLNRMSEKKYDLVLLDHLMPVMDGVETLNRIRENEKYDSIPIIALTANALGNAHDRYVSLGFSDYLSKPIVSESLEKMLIQYLPEDKVEKV